MSKLNRGTLKQKVSDFINRVSPFDGNALIQKTELNEIEDDFADSQIFKISTEATVTNPAAAFSLDFDTVDEYNIDLTAGAPTAYTITLQNLESNQRGKINVTKKTTQTIEFANASLSTFNGVSNQDPLTLLNFDVKISGGVYSVDPLYDSEPVPDAVQYVEQPVGNQQIFMKSFGYNNAINWNMNSNQTLNIAHGLNLANFRLVGAKASILASAFNTQYDFNEGRPEGIILSGGTNVVLDRDNGGFFDNSSFTSATVWLTIFYIAK